MCPLDKKKFAAFVKFLKTDQAGAMKVYTENEMNYPPEFEAYYSSDIEAETITEVNTPQFILDQKAVLEKAKGLISKKIRRLSAMSSMYEGLDSVVDNLQALADKMNKYKAEYALFEFVEEAKNMVEFAERKMQEYADEVKSGKEVPLFKIKNLWDSIAAFDLLNDIKEDFLEDSKYGEAVKLITEITGKKDKIRNMFINLSRDTIAKEWSPYFNKLYAIEEEKAERAFNKDILPNLRGKLKAEISKKKEAYISTWMESRAEALRDETRLYVGTLLERSIDISSASAQLVNPRDINSDIIQTVMSHLDDEDFLGYTKKVEKLDKLQSLFENYTAYVGSSSNSEELYAPILAKDAEGNTLFEIINPLSVNWKEFKSKYTGTPVMEFYDELSAIVKEKDILVGKSKQLGYVLPAINKNNFERVSSSGVISFLKESITDSFKLKEADTGFGETTGDNTTNVITDEANRERNVVPLFYRNQGMATEDRSFDVMSLMYLDYVNSVDYNTRLRNLVKLETLKEIVDEIEFVKTNSIGSKVKKDQTGNIVGVKGDSNTAVALRNIIEQRIYGRTIEGDPKIAKIAQTFQSYTSMLGLATNWLSGAANFLQGGTISWIDSIGENSGAYNKTDRAKAVLDYDKDMVGILGDIGKRVPSSKTNLLARKFNAFSENAHAERFANNNRVKRMTNSNSLLLFNNVGEHAIQSIVMYSILNNIKAMTADNMYLDKDFNPTSDIKNAISIKEAFIVKDGVLSLHENVAKTNKTDGVTDLDMAQISKLIRDKQRDLFGNYDSTNKATFQRTIVGALAFQMRGWVVPGIQRRWRGIQTSTTDVNSLRVDQRYYDQQGNALEEGIYTTTARYVLTETLEDLKALKILALLSHKKEQWQSLTDKEKANIKKTIAELGTAVLALVASKLLKELGEDDDEYIVLALLSRRLYSELITFVNPLEAVRTFRNPLYILNTITDVLNLLIQLTDPTEEYESGSRKGELKITRRLEKLIPVLKQLDKNPKDMLKFLEM
jgi:hypothetical protein